ncbi:MAG: hypothetical protein N3D80_10230 [Ignavibacterium album]|jgi:hypothetical protein|uniref:hypothetical protein n=1 Tax=Ignavibacterium album TaxID=591197 RepID=UPI0026E9CAA5|nr:hypothetical protein [Ignavibacterium album]MCX8106232.1 hypothetical protein [Ignavibacterium album]
MKQLIFCLMLSVILISCGGSEYVVKYNGDEVEINSLSEKLYEGELLALTNEEMIILLKYKDNKTDTNIKHEIASINFGKIGSVTVKGYSDKEWRTGVWLMQIIPALAIGLEAGAYTGEIVGGLAFGLLLTIPGWITYLIFDAASPDPPQWNSDVNDKESFKQLNIYTRFPMGITQSQLEELLKYYNQKEVYKLK